MSSLLHRRLEHASSFGHNFANIPISRPDAPSQQAVQTKLNIGEPGDKFEKDVDQFAEELDQLTHAPVSGQAEQNLQIKALKQDAHSTLVQLQPEQTNTESDQDNPFSWIGEKVYVGAFVGIITLAIITWLLSKTKGDKKQVNAILESASDPRQKQKKKQRKQKKKGGDAKGGEERQKKKPHKR